VDIMQADLVYASLAMINAKLPKLPIDYCKPIVDLWVDTAKKFIEELPWGHHLNILSWCTS
jgi:hypothetical protein